jgi:hypothetical protein
MLLSNPRHDAGDEARDHFCCMPSADHPDECLVRC